MTANQQTLKFERLPIEYFPETMFRPKTQMFSSRMAFVFVNGGMGDYATWLQPIRWLATETTWLKGTLVCPVYLKEMAEYFLKPLGWPVITYKDIPPNMGDVPFRGPVELQRESLNATGAHLSTCGWVYFTNKEKAPEGWDSYPQFKQEDLDKIVLPEAAQDLKWGEYVVVTTGKTTPSREVPGKYWNPIIEHIRSKGLKPVFLGKSVVETGNASNIHTKFDQAIQYDRGLNLIDKTSLMQAAAIMSRAACVVGHDNGLLHIAGCTPTVPIVFGYNLASPNHREPKRPHLKNNGCYNVNLTSKELACNFCQSNFNFLIGYNFRHCFYSDLACIHKLFENNGMRWIMKIDQALGDKDANRPGQDDHRGADTSTV